MLKIIETGREQPGKGVITRFALELPWFSVWIDVDEVEAFSYKDSQDLGAMLYVELSIAGQRALEKSIAQAFAEGVFEKFSDD